ncbi:hypothetical protein MHAE_00955 [Mycobacterium haemophilum DSM 44634]|uniref:hypothetical protein n=1 Tax=Mycobacterium haemophilum TaxID=29311 RepID=UPI0006554978|nr:hypothetical protein [Mycobacterium haemophilum]AKN16881.1 hypothetical protein B586_10475 [Mycobacterium haemophilum DSM 44634]MCV7340272.1 hypothetical protein [Mycobacterium haemophilum DSM 44634]
MGSNSAIMHFIVDGIDGEPELYCLQKPSLHVVDSFGGGGRKKHYGGPSGCASVKRYIDEDGDYRKGPRAIYLYGEPLPAEEVIEREWCARCGGYWFNAGGVSEDYSDEFMRKETRWRIRGLTEDLAARYNE